MKHFLILVVASIATPFVDGQFIQEPMSIERSKRIHPDIYGSKRCPLPAKNGNCFGFGFKEAGSVGVYKCNSCGGRFK